MNFLNRFIHPEDVAEIFSFETLKRSCRGVLDVLANRCLAQGTNAWTATDASSRCEYGQYGTSIFILDNSTLICFH